MSALHWRTGGLPADTALFVVGDVHANHVALKPLLAAMQEEIEALPAGVRAEIFFLGDYIDRGPSAPLTLEALLGFERFVMGLPNASVTFLCGNHDEYFSRVITCTGVVDELVPEHPNTRSLFYTTSTPEGALRLHGLETWLFIGGGITTLQDYFPDIEESLLDREARSFNRSHPQFSAERIATMLQKIVTAMPRHHREFFERCRELRYVIVGDYLITHAGVDPVRTLQAQGIGPSATAPVGKELIDFLMIRNPFLWRESLPLCPYIILHGHTPSDIEAGGARIADGQKDYRLCMDTAAYLPAGAITCFIRHGDAAWFMAVNNTAPAYVVRYSIPPLGQRAARQFHAQRFPQYHESRAS